MKSALLELIRSELRSSFERLTSAAMEAHAAATDPDSKAESKYDTRNLEASYLATGQARQVEELAEAIRIFESMTLPEFDAEDPIDAGTLVEVDLSGESQWFLLVPVAGGLEVSHQGMEITLLTPASALYQNLLGLRVGDSLDHPALLVLEVA